MANIGGLTKTIEAIYNAVSPARRTLLRAPSPTLQAAQEAAARLTGSPREAEILARQAATKGGLSPARVLQMVPEARRAERMDPRAFGKVLVPEKRYLERGKNPTIAEDTVLLEESVAQLLQRPTALPKSIKQDMLGVYTEALSEANLLSDPEVQSILKGKNVDSVLQNLQQFTAKATQSGRAPDLQQNTFDNLFGSLSNSVVDDLLARTPYYAKKMPELPLEQNYADVQRQSFPGVEQAQIFSSVLRGPESKVVSNWDPDYGHFYNDAMYGHVRGSVLPDERVLIEELQSDPLRFAPKAPEFQGIYGQLVKGVLERAVDSPTKGLIIPDYLRMTEARDASPSFLRDVYEQQLGKQFYGPLSQAGLQFKADNGFNVLNLDNETKRILRTNPELLGFKKGGLAQAAGK